MTNDKERGVADRARNGAKDHADYKKERKKDAVAKRIDAGGRSFGTGRLGLRMDQKKREREANKKDIDAGLDHRMEARRQTEMNTGTTRSGRRMSDVNRRSHTAHETAELHKGERESRDKEHWEEHKLHTPELRDI